MQLHVAINAKRTGSLLSGCLFWYARHGHKLMGCKSPVGESPLIILNRLTATTSEWQGPIREERSGGSR